MRELQHDVSHVRLQCPATGQDHTDTDRTLDMKTLEVLEIAVVEGILVVPLDLQRDRALIGVANMVNLMSGRSPLYSIDRLQDNDFALFPRPLG